MNTDSAAKVADRKVKVLIADDEEIIRNRLKELGEKLGFEVYAALDGVDGWEIFRDIKPDLAILLAKSTPSASVPSVVLKAYRYPPDSVTTYRSTTQTGFSTPSESLLRQMTLGDLRRSSFLT